MISVALANEAAEPSGASSAQKLTGPIDVAVNASISHSMQLSLSVAAIVRSTEWRPNIWQSLVK